MSYDVANVYMLLYYTDIHQSNLFGPMNCLYLLSARLAGLPSLDTYSVPSLKGH